MMLNEAYKACDHVPSTIVNIENYSAVLCLAAGLEAKDWSYVTFDIQNFHVLWADI